MVGGPGLRFALEAAFLVVLAIAAGLAELSPTTIVLVMAGAWLLVAVIEWLAWRESAPLTRVVREEAAPEEPVPTEVGRGWRFWRRRKPEPAEPEPIAPSATPPAATPAAPPPVQSPRSGEDTQDLGPSPDPPAAIRADERTGT
jgi:hypothetical protein